MSKARQADLAMEAWREQQELEWFLENDGRRHPVTGDLLEVLCKLGLIGIVKKTHIYCSLDERYP